jgi:hypothetical protein
MSSPASEYNFHFPPHPLYGPPSASVSHTYGVMVGLCETGIAVYPAGGPGGMVGIGQPSDISPTRVVFSRVQAPCFSYNHCNKFCRKCRSLGCCSHHNNFTKSSKRQGRTYMYTTETRSSCPQVRESTGGIRVRRSEVSNGSHRVIDAAG